MNYFVLFAGFLIAIIIVTILIGVILSVWVYMDAKKRDMDELGWAIGSFAINCICGYCCCCPIVGCVVYLISRGNHPPYHDHYQQGQNTYPTFQRSSQGPRFDTRSQPMGYETNEGRYRERTNTDRPPPQRSPFDDKKTCKFCGTEVDKSENFCRNCGSNEFK